MWEEENFEARSVSWMESGPDGSQRVTSGSCLGQFVVVSTSLFISLLLGRKRKMKVLPCAKSYLFFNAISSSVISQKFPRLWNSEKKNKSTRNITIIIQTCKENMAYNTATFHYPLDSFNSDRGRRIMGCGIIKMWLEILVSHGQASIILHYSVYFLKTWLSHLQNRDENYKCPSHFWT